MKTCLADGCERNVFSNKYCPVHQYMRTDDKWLNNTKIKPVKPRSFKKCTNTKAKQNNSFKSQLQQSFGFDTQKQMFNFIWLNRHHVCALSGQDLNLIPNSKRHWTMAHIIPKGLYPLFKLNPDNILLIHPDIHQMVDNFTSDMPQKNTDIDFGLWFKLVEQKKEEYKLFLKENLL